MVKLKGVNEIQLLDSRSVFFQGMQCSQVLTKFASKCVFKLKCFLILEVLCDVMILIAES